jgi:hypothetical protein
MYQDFSAAEKTRLLADLKKLFSRITADDAASVDHPQP